MVLHLLLDPALVAGLRPAALVVLAVDVVLHERDLGQVRARAAQQPGAPAVGEQHAPPVAAVQRGQRLDVRALCHDRVVGDGLGELEDLEQPGARGREDREPVRALGVQRAELALDPREVLLERDALVARQALVVAHEASGPVEQRPDLRSPCGRRGELLGIEVDEDAEHLALGRLQGREVAQALP